MLIDKTRQNFVDDGHPLLVTKDEDKQIRKPYAGVEIVKPVQLIGRVRQYSARGKVYGYQCLVKGKSTAFPISKYGSLEAAKSAADSHRRQLSN